MHDTYLHAGAGKGWPHDHTSEDTFDLPPLATILHEAHKLSNPVQVAIDHALMVGGSPEYKAEYTANGGAVLVLYTPAKIIARFDTFADATTAARALNETKGY